MPFTAAELEEMRRADEEIERDFRWTQEELEASRRRDRAAVFAALPPEKQRNAAYQKAYYEANRDKVAAAQRWIHDARVERGYTQRDLARLCGCSQPTIAMLERGMIALERCRCAQRLREILER